MTTARHGGKLGDAVFSIPALKALKVDVLYLPEQAAECSNLYSSLKRIMQLQGFEVRKYTDNLPYQKLDKSISVDYDFDQARNQPKRGVTHLVKRYLNYAGIDLPNWKDPWLIVDDVKPIKDEYVVINYTGRHLMNDYLGIRSQVDWTKVYHSIPEKKFFIGTKAEHDYFCNTFAMIDWFPTGDMLDVARVVNGAKAVYLNQSSCLAICQGLGKPYYLDHKPYKSNCLMYTQNEKLLYIYP